MKPVVNGEVCEGSRSQRKKVKGEKKLSHALVALLLRGERGLKRVIQDHGVTADTVALLLRGERGLKH